MVVLLTIQVAHQYVLRIIFGKWNNSKSFPKKEAIKMVRCGRCGRKLKNVEAIKAGFGKICYEKVFGQPFPVEHKPKVKHYHADSSSYAAKKTARAEAIPLFAGDVTCSRGAQGEPITNVPQRIILHSPDGFEWGYCGSGPADFALNILSLYIGEEAAQQNGLYQRFKEAFLSKLPHEGGIIKRNDIMQWLNEHDMDKKRAPVLTTRHSN
jgi:hypothetical protein